MFFSWNSDMMSMTRITTPIPILTQVNNNNYKTKTNTIRLIGPKGNTEVPLTARKLFNKANNQNQDTTHWVKINYHSILEDKK